jgi:hypothetical protein
MARNVVGARELKTRLSTTVSMRPLAKRDCL